MPMSCRKSLVIGLAAAMCLSVPAPAFAQPTDPTPNLRIVDLGTVQEDQSYAAAINARGQAVGGSSSPEHERAVLWENGSLFVLEGLGTDTSGAKDINDRGHVVGDIIDASGTPVLRTTLMTRDRS